jgi:hypothetical protein
MNHKHVVRIKLDIYVFFAFFFFICCLKFKCYYNNVQSMLIRVLNYQRGIQNQ